MIKRFAVVAVVAAGVCFTASQAMAVFDKNTQKCESTVGKESSKQVDKQVKCVNKCLKAERKLGMGVADFSGCLASPPTDPCITDPVKGPAAKASAKIGKICGKGPEYCPDCYQDGTPISCADGQPQVDTNTTLTATQGPAVFCIEYNVGAYDGVPTKEEAKCEDTAAKELSKLVKGINKCYDKCDKNALNGKIPFDACAPTLGATPPLTDQATIDCLTKISTKEAEKIDKKCGDVGASPACWGGLDGAGWVSLISTIVGGQTGGIACGSPSGAFLN
jgi:hypothetical protein